MGGFNTNVPQPLEGPYIVPGQPQFHSPLEIAGQMQDFQARRQAMQTGQLQQQALQMENQQRQLDLQDQQYMRKAWMDANGDLDLTLKNFQKLGGSPKAAFALNQQVTQMKTNNEKLTSEQLANKNLKNDQLEAVLQPVIAETDPNKQTALWNNAVSTAVKQGLMTPEEAQQHPYPGAEGVVSYAKGLETEKWLTAQAAKQRAQAAQDQAGTSATKETREAGQQQFQNAVSALAANPPQNPLEYKQRLGALPGAVAMRFLDAVPVGAYDPQTSVQTLRRLGMTGEQQTQADQAAANAARDAAHNKVVEGQGAQRIGLERQAQALRQKQFDATYGALLGPNGEQLSPEAQKAMAEQDPMAAAIANYKLPPPTASRSGPGAATLRKVMAINPDYDAKDWQNRSNTLKEFSSSSNGKAGGQIIALNTLVHHADLYMEAAKALKNGNFVPGNGAYNSISTMMGQAAPQNAALVARFLAGETGKVATGGVPAEGEINGILGKLTSNGSEEQMDQAGQKLLQIAAGRMGPLREKAEAAHIGKLVQIVGPEAQEILKRRGFDPQTMKPAAVAGGQQGGGGGQSSNYSHIAQGPNGHQIGSNDGKTWYDLQTGKKVQ